MSDFSRLLISRVIAGKNIVPAMSAGIRPDWFDDAEHRRVWNWMLQYFNRYGRTPTARALKDEFPAYRLVRTEEPFQYYIDRFRDQRRRSITVDAVVETDEALNSGDLDAAQAKLSKGLLRLGSEVSSLSDENVVKTARERYASYVKGRKESGMLTGIPTGFPTIDMITGGFQPQQFVILGGQAKQAKSFLLMKMAMSAQQYGKKVLFISFEMSVFEQMVRYDAMSSGVNSQHVLHGTLNDEELKRLSRGMASRKNMPSFIVSADISATTTLSGLSGKVEQHQPDIIFVDGVYLMDNEAGHVPQSSQAYTSISRGLKRLAQRVEKPLIGTTQALPGKMERNQHVTLHSLGWTSAWSQDADLILGTERMDNGQPMLKLRVVAGRNVSPREVTVSTNWDESIIEETDDLMEEEE